VADDRKLVILRHGRDFAFRRTYLPRPASVSLDEVLDDRGDFAHYDHPTRLAELAEQRLEGSNRFGAVLERVVGPREDDCFNGIDFEKRGTDEPAELRGVPGNG
jgi:hypothetical protein